MHPRVRLDRTAGRSGVGTKGLPRWRATREPIVVPSWARRTGRNARDEGSTWSIDIDLLLTDIVMPGMPGNELATRLRADGPGLPVLYVSGFTEESVLAAAIDGEVPYVLPKPYTADTLGLAVRAALGEPPGG